MKLLCKGALACREDMRVNRRSVRPITAASAGTKDPTCARNTMMPTAFRKQLFPDMLGPVITCSHVASQTCSAMLTGGKSQYAGHVHKACHAKEELLVWAA